MDLCAYVTWFGLFSVIGWLYECTYCAIKTKKWDNRGFLFGPVCPIYGFGGIMVIAAANLVESAVHAGGAAPEPWQVFVVSALGSAVLEYVTSYVLERWFHARWWDYSNVPLNLNGRICLPFTLCFGLAGMAVYYYASEAVVDASAAVPLIVWEVAALVTVGLMSADLALTNAALSDLDGRIEEAQADFDAVMDVAVEDMASGRMPLADDIRAHTRRLAGDMGSRQRKVLSKMRTFSTDARTAVARGLREAIENEREELEALEDRHSEERAEQAEQTERCEQEEPQPDERP
jgi:uncharacterized membrane protein